MLLTKTVMVKWNVKVRKHYEEKGYIFTKTSDEFEINTNELNNGSHVLVEVKCDCKNCKNPFLKPMEWRIYLKCVRENEKYYCRRCAIELFAIKSIKKTKLKNSDFTFEQWCLDNDRQDILDRWDNGLNIEKPDGICYGTKHKYYFKCTRGIHESQLTSINEITNNNNSLNCTKCNSFETWCLDNNHQNWLELWDYDLNKCNPIDISCSTGKKYYFKCPMNIHKSELKQISHYTSKSIAIIKCKQCNSIAQWGIDNVCEDFIDKYWSNKNTLTPWEIDSGSEKKVWFKCDFHKDYKRNPKDSKKYEFRCPICVQEREESFLQEKTRLYLNELGYNILHEYDTLKCINPKTNHILPYDNQILNLIIEVHGSQHYNVTSFHQISSKKNNTTPEHELHMLKIRDRYKRIWAKKNGCLYLEIPYWADNKNEKYKKLIDDKIKTLK